MSTITTTTKLRFILLAVLASLSLAATTAHATPNTGGNNNHGKGCIGGNGQNMEDGEIDTYHGKYERITQTCTDGEVCTSEGVLQTNGSRRWTYECHDSPADITVAPPHRIKLPAATTSTSTVNIKR